MLNIGEIMTQYELFFRTHQQEFDGWKNTNEGGQACNRFLRIAYGCHIRGIKMGARAIVERLRWNYMTRKDPSLQYKINNNMTPYLARWAMEKEQKLKGYFNLRLAGGKNKPNRVAIVDIG